MLAYIAAIFLTIFELTSHIFQSIVFFILLYIIAPILNVILTLLQKIPIIDTWRKKFIVYIMRDPEVINSIVNREKRDLFSSLSSIKSKVESMRKKGEFRLVEIGVGSGTNFKYYPNNASIIAVDPNPYFGKSFEEQTKKYPDKIIEKFILGYGENLKEIRDQSVDAVVTTFVLCSVKNERKIFKEIQRILVPGGKYYYLEHEMDEQNSKIRKIQKFLSKSGIWPFIFENCTIDRLLDLEVCKAGFCEVEQKRFIMKGMIDHFIYKYASFGFYGVATKS